MDAPRLVSGFSWNHRLGIGKWKPIDIAQIVRSVLNQDAASKSGSPIRRNEIAAQPDIIPVLRFCPDCRRLIQSTPKGSPHSPGPDASASTVTALAPAQVVVWTVSARFMSHCLRKPVS
jgi:hypothetical protein